MNMLRSLARRPPRWPCACAVAVALAAAAASAAVSESEPNGRGAPNPVPAPIAPFLTSFGQGVAVVTGTLAAGDTDFYAVELSAGQLLMVGIFDDRGGELTDTRVGVFFEPQTQDDSSVPPVASNDDGGPGFLSRLAVPIDQSGLWKIGVTGFRDTSFTGAHLEALDGPVSYRLVIAVGTSPPARVESSNNDSLANADLLPAGGALVRGSLAPGDVDFYALDVADGDDLTVSLFDLDSNAFAGAGGERNDTRIAWFDANGAPVADGANDDGGPGFLSNLETHVPAGKGGRWRLAVSGFRDTGFTGNHLDGPFDYELAVTAASGAAPVPRCDVNSDGFVDRADIQAITLARGQPATGPSDPRDADGDGTISVLDARQCTLQCGNANCAPPAPHCGLVGIELLLPLAPWLARRARARCGRSIGWEER